MNRVCFWDLLQHAYVTSEKYHFDYFYGNKFTVDTDNNPLTYALSKARLAVTGYRWLSALASFDFDIIYRPVSANTDADVMSRHPYNVETDQISSEPINVVSGCLTKPICALVKCQ